MKAQEHIDDRQLENCVTLHGVPLLNIDIISFRSHNINTVMQLFKELIEL